MGLTPFQFLSFFVTSAVGINEISPFIEELFERVFNKLTILLNFHFHVIIKMIWIGVFQDFAISSSVHILAIQTYEKIKSVIDKLVCCLPPGELSLETIDDWKVRIYVKGLFTS